MNEYQHSQDQRIKERLRELGKQPDCTCGLTFETVATRLIALNDYAVADLIDDSSSLLHNALVGRVTTTQGLISVVDYGADPTEQTDSTEAFQQALQDVQPGGTVFVPPGVYQISETLIIDKPINLDCGRGGWTGGAGATMLRFAPGVTGIIVQRDSRGVTPSGWRVGPLELASQSTQPGDDVGLLALSGTGVLDGTFAYKFGSHGIAFIAGRNTETPGGNVNKSHLVKVRAAQNHGDGIHIEGSDAQAIVVLQPDTVINGGWGIRIINASSNRVIKPHANQSNNGQAYYSGGLGNVWDNVYSEGTATFVNEGNNTILTTSRYGRPTVEDNTLSKNLVWFDSQYGFHKEIRMQGPRGTSSRMLLDHNVAGSHRWMQDSPRTKTILEYRDDPDWLAIGAEYVTLGTSSTSPGIYTGEGDPNGVVRAGKGSLYMRTDGNLDTPSLYVKSSQGGTANWIEK